MGVGSVGECEKRVRFFRHDGLCLSV
jgi:hypothetical protein